MFRVICNVWAQTVYCTPEVVIRTTNNIPVVHIWLKGVESHSKTPMKQSAVEVTKGVVIGVPSCACEPVRLRIKVE